MSDIRFDKLPPSTLSREDFLARYGGVYEKTPWIAREVYDEGLTSRDDEIAELAGRMRACVEAAGYDEQLALLAAHPDLAGKLAAAGELTAESTSEQAGAGLDQCTPDELTQFQSLNKEYTARFGFPFILAVAGYQRAEILEIFQSRVANSLEVEFSTALEQVHKIARLRLTALAQEG